MKNSLRARRIGFAQSRRPLPGAPKMSGKLIHQHLWGPGPFRFGGGRRPHKERIEAVHASSFTQLRAARMRKTLLLLVCVY